MYALAEVVVNRIVDDLVRCCALGPNVQQDTHGHTACSTVSYPGKVHAYMSAHMTNASVLQAAYGKNALALTSFFTYVGLGLGLLGSSLALPFGLYVLICQRASEKYIQDQVGRPQGT